MFENIKKERAIILDKTFLLCIIYTHIKSRVQNHSLNTTFSCIYIYIYENFYIHLHKTATCVGTIYIYRRNM